VAVANFGRRRVAFAWAVAAAAALLSPLPPALTELAGEAPAGLPLDKLAHVALFALLAHAWLVAAAPAGGRRALTVALAAVAYGGVLELLQPLVAERTTELLDVAANALGVAIAMALRRRGKMGTGTHFR
jgi:VanZ family protein